MGGGTGVGVYAGGSPTVLCGPEVLDNPCAGLACGAQAVMSSKKMIMTFFTIIPSGVFNSWGHGAPIDLNDAPYPN